MMNMKYREILKANNLLENNNIETCDIAIISNIMVHQAKEVCEYSLRVDGVNASVELGDYDNVVQDAIKLKGSNIVLIFWEACNFIDGLQYKADLLSQEELADLINRIKMEVDIVLDSLKNSSMIILNRFSSLIFNQCSLANNKLDVIVKELNLYLESKKQANLNIIDVDKVIAKVSIAKAIDFRYYHSSKTLYSVEFYKEYFTFLKPLITAINGKAKKALIFDCDNTLWKGVLGEDGFYSIKMFKEIQFLAKTLAKNGVIIGICSKNNQEDVDEVIAKHEGMVLQDDDIVIKKVNWENKALNIRSIAKELNIGLDSLVFIDDSDFEVNLIKEALPMVKVIQVPKNEWEYNALIRNTMNLFYSPTLTEEDVNKTFMYKAQVQRAEYKKDSMDINDYLKSLGLEVTIHIDDLELINRMAQMTQKTNQFNLTTKRYTENDISKFVLSDDYIVLAIGVSDKFGDNGIVGLVILELSGNRANINTLLMSCRVIGRNIEYKLMDFIFSLIKKQGLVGINSNYIESLKNEQVKRFYNDCGFNVVNKSKKLTEYEMSIDDYKMSEIDYIRISNEK